MTTGAALDKLKEVLKEDFPLNNIVTLCLIAHNPDMLGFQFYGHCVWLQDDGTWCWEEDTSGG